MLFSYQLGKAFTDLIAKFGWDSITILYEDQNSLLRLKEIFTRTSEMVYPKSFKMILKQLVKTEDFGYRAVSTQGLLSVAF